MIRDRELDIRYLFPTIALPVLPAVGEDIKVYTYHLRQDAMILMVSWTKTICSFQTSDFCQPNWLQGTLAILSALSAVLICGLRLFSKAISKAPE